MDLLSQEGESLPELLGLLLNSLYSLHDAVVFPWPHAELLLIATVWRSTFLLVKRLPHLRVLLSRANRRLERIHFIIRDGNLKYLSQFFFIEVIATGFTV
jgi:hypothetical protein